MARLAIGLASFAALSFRAAALDDYTGHFQVMQKYQEHKNQEALDLLRPLLTTSAPAEFFWNAGVLAYELQQPVVASAYWEESLRKGLLDFSAVQWLRAVRGQLAPSAFSIEPSWVDAINNFVPWSLAWSLALAGAFACLAIYTRRGFVAGVVIFLVISFLQWRSDKPVALALVPETPFYAGASDQFPKLGTLKAGDRLLVKGRQDKYLRIETQQHVVVWADETKFVLVQ
jgi:hypothetical protein